MKKKELLKRIENLEFQLDELFFLERMGVEQIERLNKEVVELQDKLKVSKFHFVG